MAGEDRKLVWPRIAADVERLLGPGFDPATVANLVKRQREVQDHVRGPFQRLWPAPGERRSAEFVAGATNDALWSAAVRVNVLATIAEMTETLEWTPWKPWRQPRLMTPQEVHEARVEVADALCFLMNTWLLLGGDGELLDAIHAAKCRENVRRQQSGY